MDRKKVTILFAVQETYSGVARTDKKKASLSAGHKK